MYHIYVNSDEGWRDSGEGPFETYGQAEAFAKAEVGAEWQVEYVYPYVYGRPDTVGIELRVWHGNTCDGEPDETQPAVLWMKDNTAAPSDGMYDMLDKWGQDFHDQFERFAYGEQIELNTVKTFRFAGQTITYQFAIEDSAYPQG